jgi:ribosomal protein L16 Arg81 hydroxylase
MFFATENGATGGKHIDADEVYTVQLYGSKVWLVDPVSADWLLSGIRSGVIEAAPSTQWLPTGTGFVAPTRFVMEPGDFLATPAFCLHEVTTASEGHNLSFAGSLGRDEIARRQGFI